MIKLRESSSSHLKFQMQPDAAGGGAAHAPLRRSANKSVCGRGRDEKRLALPVCKINALKVVAPNRLGTVNCLDIFAQRGSWKRAPHSWDISDSSASREMEHSFYLGRSLQAGLAGGEAEPLHTVCSLLLDFVAWLNPA